MIGGVNCQQQKQQQQQSSSYFNDTTLYLDTLTIIQTHNSLAQPSLVLSPNQNVDLVKQFQDGIRGFNFDLYSRPNNNGNGGGGGLVDLWTYHGLVETWGYDPTTQIVDLVAELTTTPTEFIIIEIQDSMDSETVKQQFVPLFGNLIIKNFDSTKPISHYIGLNQRVLVMTPNDSNVDPSVGMHDTKRLTHENNYQWDTNTCLDGSAVPSKQERYPPAKSWNNKYTRPLRVMNHFCVNPTFRSGDASAARVVNRPARILQSANELASVEPFSPQINMIHVDFYELGGDVFDALRRLQEMAGYYTSDGAVGTVVDQVIDQCWPDSTVCDVSTTCWQCCVDESYWTSRSSYACGVEELGTGDTGTGAGTGTTEEEEEEERQRQRQRPHHMDGRGRVS
mmetsp:Transcript_40100/g.96823  ORF Transcript_40100/g.96823 Transcript_40100/m.96823 type:complete len:395 (+) Transcript_40100:3-1187(+)